MLPTWAATVAPCLSKLSYSGEAAAFVEAGLALPSDSYGAFHRAIAAYNISFHFRYIERDLKDDPTPVFKKALLDSAAAMRAAAQAMPAQRYPIPSPPGERTDAQVTAQHYSSLFSAFDPYHHFEEPTQLFRQRLERNGYDLTRFPNWRALDAGCGGGRYSVALRKLGMAEVVGLDLSERNVAEATARCKAAGITGVTFDRGNVLDLPYPDNSFDFVCSSGVLHHTTDCQKGVNELVRVLKPGGCGFFRVMSDPGGMHWDFIELCRVLFRDVPHEFVHQTWQLLNVPANLRYFYLDHMLVPINIRYTDAQCRDMLAKAGAVNVRQLPRGADIDRDERIYRKEPFTFEKFGIGVNRFYFEKAA